MKRWLCKLLFKHAPVHYDGYWHLFCWCQLRSVAIRESDDNPGVNPWD